ncbi:hypothetical protein [Nitrospira moscoviensis]|uniref:Uncharacterized protein n=1 Tax=Nitrospira moscoviensis TaxID=42253 RepID=A0A0K2GFJ7_NITMO|nr:hypothetical protein [Nitrospira moscoviensis]ALA59735.1 hypothetical protein NITMOv2_3342 [Nitrospira moscoviensis]
MSKKIADALKGFNLRTFAKKEKIDAAPSNTKDPPSDLPARQKLSDSFPACLSFLSVDKLLEWSESVTKATATAYDKAMDKMYLQDRIGGGNHRMFDGGHDLAGAWEAAKSAKPDDTFQQEVIGYASGLWKDLTTVKGLPFTTWEQQNFNDCAEWVVRHIPGATKDWFYDLMSYDALEVVGASLGAASVLFCFSRQDKQKLAEMIGSMGAVSVASANPLMGVALVLCVAYSYFVKKQEIDPKHAAVGAGLAGISACIFAALGLPVLVELGIAITVTTLLRRHVINNEALVQFINMKAANISVPSAFTARPACLPTES